MEPTEPEDRASFRTGIVAAALVFAACATLLRSVTTTDAEMANDPHTQLLLGVREVTHLHHNITMGSVVMLWCIVAFVLDMTTLVLHEYAVHKAKR